MITLLVERMHLSRQNLGRGLWLAAFDGGDEEAVRALLEAGAGIDDVPRLLASPCFGHQPDDDAGVEAVIEVLLDAGLDPNDEDEHGFRPLLTALGPDTFGPGYQESDGCNRPAALALIRRGADVNIRYPDTEIASLEGVNASGFTPLHLAARVGDPVLIRALLDAGADPSARTPDGRTAFDLAVGALETYTGPGATPPEVPPEGAPIGKLGSAAEERQRWDRFAADAAAAVDLLAPAFRDERGQA